MRFLRWFGDVIWVYIIPIVVVLNVVQPPLAFLVFGTLGALLVVFLAALLYTGLIGARVLLLLTKRRPATPESHG